MRAYVETDRGKYIDVTSVKYAITRPANIIQHPAHEQGRWVIDMILPSDRVNPYFKTMAGDFASRGEATVVIESLFKTLECYFEEFG